MVGELAESGQETHAKTGLLIDVVAVDDETVTVDFDPERSGQVLIFDVEAVDRPEANVDFELTTEPQKS